MNRSDLVTEEHLVFLDELRDGGETNMYGATPWLVEEFALTKTQAREVLGYWMETFSERHHKDTKRAAMA